MYGPGSMRGDHAPRGHAPRGHAPRGHAPRGHAPRGHAPRGPPPELYSIHRGVVSKIESYGAFVELPNRFQGLLHISQLANYKVDKVEDCVSVGDYVWIKVTEIKEAEDDGSGRPPRPKVSFSLRYCSQEDGADLDQDNVQLFEDQDRRSGPRAPSGGFNAEGKFSNSYMDAGANTALGKKLLTDSAIGIDPIQAMKASLGSGRGRPKQLVLGTTGFKNTVGGGDQVYELVTEPEEAPAPIMNVATKNTLAPPAKVVCAGRGRGTTLPAWMTNPENINSKIKTDEDNDQKGGRSKKHSKSKEKKTSKKEKREKKKKKKQKKKQKKKKRRRSSSSSSSSTWSESDSDESGQFENIEEALEIVAKLEKKRKRE